VPPVEEALAYPYSPQERAYIEHSAQTTVDGDPQQVREKLEAIADVFQTDDLSVVTICYAFADRVRSYELVAKACGLEAGRKED
jgi:alkanesulfonate monooxygenase SsuD/methylene tetrahydromethanopterin reductase-like flavin-dependent oxidoreductase (luciferase family)